jgi:hypothetical protein
MASLRARTPEERNADVQQVFMVYGESLAALAWDGYQQLGRGVVLVTEQDAKFCPRADLFVLPSEDCLPIVHMSDDYDPVTQVAVVFLMPQTPHVCEEAHMFFFSPEVPPPQAQADPLSGTVQERALDATHQLALP